MPDPRLVEYIKANLAKGYPEAQIEQVLLSAGHDANAINEAFATLIDSSPIETEKPAPPRVEPMSAPWKVHLVRISGILIILLAIGGVIYYLFLR